MCIRDSDCIARHNQEVLRRRKIVEEKGDLLLFKSKDLRQWEWYECEDWDEYHDWLRVQAGRKM